MQSIVTNKQYRPEIDGLRAIAVVLVLLYHFDFKLISGGFIGVDIFFVLSGYLVTGVIIESFLRDEFDFFAFYFRRIRRLIPALVFTIFISGLVGYFIFTPEHLARLGSSSLAALFSIANMFFLFESGYFAPDSSIKPLLHTWSLSVEEQFYLVWPALVIYLLKTGSVRRIKIAFFVIFTSSFIISEWLAINHPRLGFLFTGSRIFEFSIGAIVFLYFRQLQKHPISLYLPYIGILVILICSVTYTKDTIFPGLNALVIAISSGFCLLVLPNNIFYKILTNSTIVYIGKISYSLYLVHWPVVVAYKYIFFRELKGLDIAIVITITAALALICFYGVENRFRVKSKVRNDGETAKMFGIGLLVLVGVIVSVSVFLKLERGIPSRFADNEILASEFALNNYKEYTWNRVKEIELTQPVEFTEVENNMQTLNILTIGDSQSGDLVNILEYMYPENNVHIASIIIPADCQVVLNENTEYSYSFVSRARQRDCNKLRSNLIKTLGQIRTTTVIIAANWKEEAVPYIQSTINAIKVLTDAEIFIVGKKTIGANATMQLINNSIRDNVPISSHQPILEQTRQLNSEIKNIVSSSNFIDIFNDICPTNTDCKKITEEGQLVIYDSLHLTPYGAKMLAESAAFKTIRQLNFGSEN